MVIVITELDKFPGKIVTHTYKVSLLTKPWWLLITLLMGFITLPLLGIGGFVMAIIGSIIKVRVTEDVNEFVAITTTSAFEKYLSSHKFTSSMWIGFRHTIMEKGVKLYGVESLQEINSASPNVKKYNTKYKKDIIISESDPNIYKRIKIGVLLKGGVTHNQK